MKYNDPTKAQYHKDMDEYIQSLSDLDRLLLLIGMLTNDPAVAGFSHKSMCAVATGWPMDKIEGLFQEATDAGFIKRTDVGGAKGLDFSSN